MRRRNLQRPMDAVLQSCDRRPAPAEKIGRGLLVALIALGRRWSSVRLLEDTFAQMRIECFNVPKHIREDRGREGMLNPAVLCYFRNRVRVRLRHQWSSFEIDRFKPARRLPIFGCKIARRACRTRARRGILSLLPDTALRPEFDKSWPDFGRPDRHHYLCFCGDSPSIVDSISKRYGLPEEKSRSGRDHEPYQAVHYEAGRRLRRLMNPGRFI